MPLFEQFISSNGKVRTPEIATLFSQFGAFEINQLMHKASHLFSIDDINQMIWKHERALKVYKILYHIFKDVEPIPDDMMVGAQGNPYDEESDEDEEWNDLIDGKYTNVSVSNMDMS